MKKRITLLALLLVCLLTLTGCFCEHEWIPADCVNPAICSKCEETEGTPNGHVWMAATCAAPKTCEVCGETEGEAKPHTWADATCTAPKTCTVCAATEGEALEHTWLDATYEAPMTCEVCGETQGEPLVASIEDSDAFDTITGILDEQMSDLNPEYVIDEELSLLYVYLDAPSGTALGLVSDPAASLESWNEVVYTMCDLSTSIQEEFTKAGMEVNCSIMLVSDANAENILMGCLNGEVIYNVMDDLL